MYRPYVGLRPSRRLREEDDETAPSWVGPLLWLLVALCAAAWATWLWLT